MYYRIVRASYEIAVSTLLCIHLQTSFCEATGILFYELKFLFSVKKVVNNTQLLMHCFKTFGGSLDQVDFCMCNPPFYSSIHDMDLARTVER